MAARAITVPGARVLPEPRRILADDPALSDVRDLILRAFAYMEGRINPPSSIIRMSLEDAKAHARDHEIWAIGTPPVAACFLTFEPERLYLGRLAVDQTHRRKGLAARLVALAEARAKAKGLSHIELGSRVELVENHRAFAALGFVRFAETANEGFDRPTTYWFRKTLS